jgi:hypothetical protein
MGNSFHSSKETPVNSVKEIRDPGEHNGLHYKSLKSQLVCVQLHKHKKVYFLLFHGLWASSPTTHELDHAFNCLSKQTNKTNFMSPDFQEKMALFRIEKQFWVFLF